MTHTRYLIIGNGHLSQHIRNRLGDIGKTKGFAVDSVVAWNGSQDVVSNAVMVHAGSGRLLADAIGYCQQNSTPMIQASTGMNYLQLLPQELSFILVEAPNLSIPIIKLMYALEQSGPLFSKYDISVTESHQNRKTSLPGTARAFAEALGRSASEIKSIRDPEVQRNEYRIPEEYLARHAKHMIDIEDEGCRITIQTEALGYDSYLYGIVAISQAIQSLKNGRYLVTDLVAKGII